MAPRRWPRCTRPPSCGHASTGGTSTCWCAISVPPSRWCPECPCAEGFPRLPAGAVELGEHLVAVQLHHVDRVRSHVRHVDLVEPGLDVRLEGLEVRVRLRPAGDGLRGLLLRHQFAGLLEVA